MCVCVKKPPPFSRWITNVKFANCLLLASGSHCCGVHLSLMRAGLLNNIASSYKAE